MPPSRMVSVWSTEVLAAMSDASEVMVKSASVGVVMPCSCSRRWSASW